MKKQKWETPVIEEIVLKFDKEMGTACFGSSSTPDNNKGGCGLQAPVANNCWNRGGPSSSIYQKL